MILKNTLLITFLLLITPTFKTQIIELSESEVNQKYDKIEIKDLKFKNITEVRKLYKYSINKKYQSGILRGLVAMQRHYLLESNYTLSLQYGKQAEEIAIRLKNYQILTAIYMYKGDVFTKLGMEQEAYEALNTSLKNNKKIKNNADKKMLLSAIYSIYAALYANQNKNNLVVEYYKNALNLIESISATNMDELQKTRYFYLLIFHNMNMGNTYDFYNNPPEMEKAEYYFIKTLSFSKSHPKEFNIAAMSVYYSVASFYLIKKDYPKCIEYSEKLLEVEKSKKNPEIRLYAYDNIRESYDSINNLTMQNKYLKLYSQLSDSLSNIKKNSVIIHSEHQANRSKGEISNLKIYLLSSITIAGIIIAIIFVYFDLRNKNLKKKYLILVDKLENNNLHGHQNINRLENDIVKSNISTDKEKKLLKKLCTFETSEKFLRKNLTLSYMSNLFNTNPKYLSQLIREHKGQNFSSYINQLRINYITQKLYNVPLYREYKISYLAEECGYASPQVFINAFRKETGMTPSYFINELKNQQNIEII
ncbi:helix-turn-helix domain-containing protein [Elizabethkingia ursingii]